MPSGTLREFADAIISRDKYKVSNSELRELADAITSGDKYKVSSIYPKLGLNAKVCIAYVLIIGKFNN